MVRMMVMILSDDWKAASRIDTKEIHVQEACFYGQYFSIQLSIATKQQSYKELGDGTIIYELRVRQIVFQARHTVTPKPSSSEQ